MTNNFSLFATKYIITGNNFLFFLFLFLIPLDSFNPNILKMTIVSHYLRLMALSDFANNNSFSKQQKNTKI